jgi:hypothetical protein
LFEMWSDQLQDIPPDLLDAACDRLMKTWRFPKLPLPGDVRVQLNEAETKGFELEADQEWENALRVATEFWHPEIGLYPNAPRLSPAAWHALRTAGGLSHLFNCSREDLQWARKRFVAAYTLVHETGQIEHLLGASEAKRILAQIKAGPPRKQLATARPSGQPESSGSGIPRDKVRTTLDGIVKPSVPAERE